MEWTKLDITKASVVRSEVDKIVTLLSKNNGEAKDLLGTKNIIIIFIYVLIYPIAHSLFCLLTPLLTLSLIHFFQEKFNRE